MSRFARYLVLIILVGMAAPSQALPILLNNVPDYDWWYGCTPTSAGMLMGYYDINGYAGYLYNNLIPGGVAELNSFGDGGGQDYDGDPNPDLLCNKAIASAGHIADFWRQYNQSKDTGYPDPLGGNRDGVPGDPYDPEPNFDSLADFMGTSQDGDHTWKQITAVDGATQFEYYTNGNPLTYTQVLALGPPYSQFLLGGIYEYVTHQGYSVGTLYNQLRQGYGGGAPNGCTFAVFQAEIDAGRPALLHLYGHTMLAYGYDADGQKVYVHDTWTSGAHIMTWGGSYGGMTHMGMTFFELAPTPEASPLLLFGFGVVLFFVRRRCSARKS